MCPPSRLTQVALLLLATVSLAIGADAPPAELPVYVVGEQWALTDATYRLDRIQRDAYVFVADGNREIWLGRDLGLRYVRRGSDSIEVDPPPGLTWPLTVGRRGGRITFARFRGSELGEVEVQSSWRVMDFEDVEVAGRKMGAFRILYQLDPEIPGRFRDNPYQRYGPIARSAKFDYTVWYAPDARRIVRVQSSKPLLNFELQGAPPATAQAPVAVPQPEPPRPAAPRAAARAQAAPPPAAPAPPAVAVPPAVAAPPAVAPPPVGARAADDRHAPSGRRLARAGCADRGGRGRHLRPRGGQRHRQPERHRGGAAGRADAAALDRRHGAGDAARGRQHDRADGARARRHGTPGGADRHLRARAQRRAAGPAAAVTACLMGGHHRRRPLRKSQDSLAAVCGGGCRGDLQRAASPPASRRTTCSCSPIAPSASRRCGT